MPNLLAAPLPPGCPWSGWTPPNVNWCEEELCSWIVNPADTGSNLAYIALGLWMVAEARDRRSDPVALFGPASILVGVFSFVYHASYTYFFQFFDFVGMFVFCFAAITANALRLGWIAPARRLSFYLVGVGVFSLLVPIVSETDVPIQALVALLIAAIVGQEATIARRRTADEPPTARGLFYVALALVGAGAAASLADVTRVWCDPQNHWIQGHAVWHVLTAAALYALFRFHRQIPRSGRARCA